MEGASSLARKLKVSDLVIGLTVVSFGTSAPELLVSVIASLKGSSQVVIGNILGSNIANILLILGVSAFIYPLKVTKNTVFKEIPLCLLSSVLVLLLANDRFIDKLEISQITRIDGIVLILFFIIFIYYTFGIARDLNEAQENIVKQFGFLKSIVLITAGLSALVWGGKLVVDNALKIADMLNISEGFVGLTIVAVGTSLPELFTSVIAALKKNADIAVGNVIGSNIFNVFFILGISAVIKPLPFVANNHTDAMVAIFASLLLFIFMFTGKWKRIDRWEGVVFMMAYVSYILFLLNRG